MAITKEVNVAGHKLTVHQLQDIADQLTGRPLTGSWLCDSALHLVHHTSASSARR